MDPVKLREEEDKLAEEELILEKKEEDISRRESFQRVVDADEAELREKKAELSARQVEVAKREAALVGKEDLTFIMLNEMRVELRMYRGIGPLVLQIPSALGPSSKSEIKAESGDYILTFPNGEIAVLTSGLINQLAVLKTQVLVRDTNFHPISNSPPNPPNPGSSVQGHIPVITGPGTGTVGPTRPGTGTAGPHK